MYEKANYVLALVTFRLRRLCVKEDLKTSSEWSKQCSRRTTKTHRMKNSVSGTNRTMKISSSVSRAKSGETMRVAIIIVRGVTVPIVNTAMKVGVAARSATNGAVANVVSHAKTATKPSVLIAPPCALCVMTPHVRHA
jgi:hypothetical protein